MLDHHRPASITPFKRRFTDGPMMAQLSGIWVQLKSSQSWTPSHHPLSGCEEVPTTYSKKWLVWNKCMFGKRPLAPPSLRPTLWIRACLKQPRMDRFLEPNEPAHEIIYEHRRRSLTRAFATYGWRQRLKTEVQTSCHAEFVRMSIKRVICVYALLTKISNIVFSAWTRVFYVFQRKASLSNMKTHHILWISQTMSARCCCASSQIKFATLINSTFQVVTEAGHVGFSIIWRYSRDESQYG